MIRFIDQFWRTSGATRIFSVVLFVNYCSKVVFTCRKEKLGKTIEKVSASCFFLASYVLLPSCDLSVDQTRTYVGDKIDAKLFLDTIPLKDAVMKECLISAITDNGSDLDTGPSSYFHLEDNFYRSLLIHCRISKKDPSSITLNTLHLEFYRGAAAEAFFDPAAKYNNLISSISVNGERVFESRKPLNDIESKEIAGLGYPELKVIWKLKGVKYPRDPQKIFDRVCNLEYSVPTFNLKFERLAGLEATMKVAPIAAKDFCDPLGGKIGKCPQEWEVCVTENGSSVPCDSIERGTKSTPLRKVPIRRYGDLADVVDEGSTDYGIGINPAYPTVAPFGSNSASAAPTMWLQFVKATGIVDQKYDPVSDQNCSTPAEVQLVQSIRERRSAPWLETGARTGIRCLDKTAPLSFKGISSSLETCDSNSGRCWTNFNFETIVKRDKIYAVARAEHGGTGLGLGPRIQDCYSKIGVANAN